MKQDPKHNEAFQLCVLIPTYNNEKTLRGVIEGVLEYTKDVIVVNDGSTDGTTEILKEYTERIEILHIEKNKGKGNALRWGFNHARALGYQYAITIDSDGQHFPSDIPVFMEELKKTEDKNLLLIGARNMDQDGIPGKSSFGNKFSNFWYWFETGFQLEDTQSGFRLYPLKELEDLHFHTTKFEFEIEVIVKAAWNGTTVKNVPIQIHYDQEDRVSHFRPFKDFTRISILNTWFVFLTIFYIKPRDLYRKLKKKGVKRFFIEDFLHHYDSPKKKALSMALGIFIGLSPFWGFHSVIVILLAIFFKLNKVIAFTFSNISLPPFIPFVVLASLYTGNFILGEESTFSASELSYSFQALRHIKAYIIGSFSLAVIASACVGAVGFVLFSFFDRKKIALNGG
ncbi:DUF2062 domain-containing protein [Galbibacter sp. EGI 63066]|uniref:DUF2062 domain-containing protein n=1 Tax=Galbibacter sp. EGI 63066 TaxID=2993559 RepID=UPI002248F529|nr:DUF2062 domain-containing protein [Galbibacter sp. EGI 63066]MCX2678350.1 DUF2062 domain-containing protein [Galbibacter sp. EGI 63066]